MSRRTIRNSRLKSAMMVGTGALTVALNVIPGTVAAADVMQRPGAARDAQMNAPRDDLSAAIANAIDRGSDDSSSMHGAYGPKPGDDDHCGCKPGKRGPQGPQGPRGPQGDIGPQGNQGDIGPQGNQGDIGPQGNQGATGPQGNQGATGPQGNQGAPGTVTATYVITATGQRTVTASCLNSDFATGGGALATNGDLIETYPANGSATTPPTEWTATTTSNNADDITAYVVCARSTP